MNRWDSPLMRRPISFTLKMFRKKNFRRPNPSKKSPSTLTTPYAFTCAKWVPSRCSLAKAKSIWPAAWNAVNSACKRPSAGPLSFKATVVELAEQVRKQVIELDDLVDLGDVEEGTSAYDKKRNELLKQFLDLQASHKKQLQLEEKFNAIAASNKKLRRKGQLKFMRAKVETSLAIRRIPWMNPKWRDFATAIEKAVEEMAVLDNRAPASGDGQGRPVSPACES